MAAFTGLVTIDGVAIENPTAVDVGIYRISKSSRAADGTMQFELIAIKRQVALSWDKISETGLATVLNQLESATFHQLTYPDPQGTGSPASKTITVYVGDISEKAWYRDASGLRWWDAVKITLIEQ